MIAGSTASPAPARTDIGDHGAAAFGVAAGDDGVDVEGAHRVASKTAASPCPPPMHMVSST